MSPSLPWHCINPSLISTLPRPGIKSWKTPEPSPRTQQHPSLAWYVLRCNRVVWRQSSAFKGCLCRRLGSLSLTSKPHPDPSLTQTRSPRSPSVSPPRHTHCQTPERRMVEKEKSPHQYPGWRKSSSEAGKRQSSPVSRCAHIPEPISRGQSSIAKTQ